ncbi:MAG: DNA phosphorothioation-associated putative methyltransferase [Alphaproteobacteria bacterium]|nr:DNA phosphorothioation-associated putative methyltransferase [Candidatus Fonsibacter sp. PEL55]
MPIIHSLFYSFKPSLINSSRNSISFNSKGWDPHFAPDTELHESDVVNIGFVINVIEDAAERADALRRAFSLSRRVLSIAVMLDSGNRTGLPFSDGLLTTRNTFQKYFTQSEFKEYIEHALEREAHMVAPGVAFVFADFDAEQRFTANSLLPIAKESGIASNTVRWRDLYLHLHLSILPPLRAIYLPALP